VRTLFLTIIALFLFTGCSAKEINEGIESISGDISNAFEKGKDKSAN